MERRYIMKLLVLLFIAVVGFTTARAQEEKAPTKALTAKILDNANQPVPNVIVSSFLGQDKAITDQEGNFTIQVALGAIDHLYVEENGFKPLVVDLVNGNLDDNMIVLNREYVVEGKKNLSFPYQDLLSDRSVSATTVITGEELKSYPATSFFETLAGRVPGMVVRQFNSTPGQESVGVAIRGVSAAVYIDGVIRDASDLAVDEVETVHVIRDLAGRAMLGLSGTNPVIWITTKSGASFKRQINATASVGLSSPVGLPEYLDAYDYATLYNEARVNDGLSPVYSQTALDAYKNNSDPVKYPNIDYQDQYVKKQMMYRKANLNFSGGDEKVNYFSMLDYVGTDGLEAIGQDTKLNRYKIRGNVNIKLNDWMKMNVNLSAVYGKRRFANEGGSAFPFNLFEVISSYPANAHPISYDNKLIVNSDYPINLTNELRYSGFAENAELNTQNSAELLIDLGSILEGLSFKAAAAFDVNNSITNNKGGTAALYRLIDDNGQIGTERIVEEQVDPNLSEGWDSYMRRTSAYGQFTYDRTFDKHALTVNASYFQLQEEIRNTDPNYQPLKKQDIGLRANYAYANKYVAQLDLSYTGSMFLQKDKRFDLYPTIGAGWIISNEDFLSDSKVVDYLKLYSSYGIMGIEYVGLSGFNSYYLFETLWQRTGSWQSGIEGNKGAEVNIYNIMQPGSNNFELPKLSFFNIGMQTDLFDHHLAVEMNYYTRRETDLFSLKVNETPSLYGGYDFLPATNYGENKYWGLDGFIQYTGKIGELNYTVGANATYNRGKYVIVDEPVALEDYRKRANTQVDNIWGYSSDGLFQSESEITSRNITQSWGAVKPGDIKYTDYNNDKVVDEKDIHDLGEHDPRISYGANLSLNYKGIGLKLIGTGVADGKTMYTQSNYFWITGSRQNYSKPMIERWPETNNYPRLTTQSVNNYQASSFWLANAAYFTLKNVEVSYTFPRLLSKKLLMSDFKVFAQGKNLFTVSDLTKFGLNPENPYAGSSMGYPLLKTITLGVACKF
ncbi:MAG: SusC/RagA family TonB-linked outer membrane protein [Bacteroidales bacterium]|nr:SusC/RagA family TonB-linked outer membrane protein [Bacteroidales bacterium]